MCHGATDNAAGVAAVLAIGRAIRKLPTPPRRSVVLALWDGEEDGLLGSLYYVDHPLVPLAQTKGYVNFDILGENLLPSLRQTSFAVGGETGGPAFQALIAGAAASEGLNAVPLSYIFGQLRSDYVSFVDGGVPTSSSPTPTAPATTRPATRLPIVNTSKLKAQSRIAYRVTAALAEDATTPAFVPPNPALAVLRRRRVAAAGGDRVGASGPVAVRAQRAGVPAGGRRDPTQIVADGPALFDGTDVSTLLTSAIQTIGAIKTLPCGKM